VLLKRTQSGATQFATEGSIVWLSDNFVRLSVEATISSIQNQQHML